MLTGFPGKTEATPDKPAPQFANIFGVWKFQTSILILWAKPENGV
jgi:hypothetical protein